MTLTEPGKSAAAADVVSAATPTRAVRPKISCFTTCMGRRHHLEQTLRKNLEWNESFPNAEFVLLDYNSDDGLGSWIANEFKEYLDVGRLNYYRYTGSKYFSYSHARNLAARLCQAEIICSVDADNFTGRDFFCHIEDQIRAFDVLVGCCFDDGVFSPIQNDHGVTGRIAIRREHFLQVGGFDEAMIAWGYEDMDLYNRLYMHGFSCSQIDRRHLSCIPHGDEERIANTQIKIIGRDWGAKEGSLLTHREMSLKKLEKGASIANGGRVVGCGRVTRNFSVEPIGIEPLDVGVDSVNGGKAISMDAATDRPRSVSAGIVDPKEANSRVLDEEFRNGVARMEGIPNVLFLELTRRCNLACSMCRPGHMTDTHLDMSEAVLRRIEEDLLPTAQVVDLRGWGESLIRRDIAGILERFAQPGVQLRLLTNGTVRKPSILRELMRLGAWVGISVDSAQEERLQELRGARLKSIEDSVASLVRWRDRFGNDPDTVRLIVTVSARNLDELPDLLVWAQGLGIGWIQMIPVACWPDSELHLGHVEQQIPPMLNRLHDRATELGMRLQLGASLAPDLALPDRVKKKCIHPWMYVYVTCAGDVGFCDHLIGRDDLTAGNLLYMPFEEIWNSPQLMSLRQAHISGETDHPFREHCNWCFKNRYADFEHKIREELSSILVTNETVPAFYTPNQPAADN